MRHYMMRRLLLLISLLLLAACNAIGQGDTIALDNADGENLPPIQQTSRSPEETALLFLDSWNNENLDTMYSLVSSRSAEIYDFQSFYIQDKII